MANEAIELSGYWPCKLAALTAVIVGVLLMLMGGGHLYGVMTVLSAHDNPVDYRFVSLLATGGILAFPGLLSLVVCRWLWQGRNWAYAVCIICASAVMIYLVLLVWFVAPDSTSVGSELNFATMIVGAYLVALIAVWTSMRITRRRQAEEAN